MNITEIKTSKFDGLGVLVPDDAQDFNLEISLEDDFCQLEYLLENTDVDSGFCGEWETNSIDLPAFDYKIIGIQTEITEEQAKGIVPSKYLSGIFEHRFFNYGREYDYVAQTALEGLGSLMQSLEMYNENPYGSYPCESGYNKPLKNSCINSCQGSCWNNDDFNEIEWQEAQSKVGKWLIIQKIK